MWLSLLYVVSSITAVLALPATAKHFPHERRDALPDYWIEDVRLDGQTVLPVRIGMTQSNLDHGHDLLMQISDPSSPKYGKHLSAKEVHDLFAPAEESVEQVRAWLKSEGISGTRISQSVNKQWLRFDATAQELERLLQTEYYLYSHTKTRRAHIACREYHVPQSLQRHIDYITPGVKFLEIAGPSPTERSLTIRDAVDASSPVIYGTNLTLSQVANDALGFCDQVITPACIRVMYNISEGTSAIPGNELGIYAFGDMYSQGDLDLLFSAFASHIPNGTQPIVQGINGGMAPTSLDNAGPESTLDLAMSYPIIWPQNPVIFQTDDPVWADPDNPKFPGIFNNFLDAIDGSYCDPSEEELDPPYPNPAPGGYKGQKQCGVYKPTNVISISYGFAEFELPIRYNRRQCYEWMKLGLQGVSVVAASGNNGVATGGCRGADRSVFTPGFLICPYITTVGGTYLPAGGDPYNPPEAAVDPTITPGNWSSGGGFSNIYERPTYQASAVEEYFSRANLDYPYYESINNNSFAANDGIYNRIGRAYPDISAVAVNNFVFWRGGPIVGGGTSAAAPIFAAMLTRINEERLAAGLPTVGFVNPMLYAHPEAFRDITEGNNPGCSTDGFTALEGWDPVTGLGTPIYSKLLEVFMSIKCSL
ncbi:hypothetical protein BDW72DRAFT_207340 [Aspergillus terricola var. indicus]